MNYDSRYLKWPISVGVHVWHNGYKQLVIAADYLKKTVTIQDTEKQTIEVILVEK